jgi:hypothetical protein
MARQTKLFELLQKKIGAIHFLRKKNPPDFCSLDVSVVCNASFGAEVMKKMAPSSATFVTTLTVVSMLAGHAVCQVISGPRISKVCSHQK